MLLCQQSPSSQGYGFPSSHVWMWELNDKESWAPKNWCFWTVVLEKTLVSPLDCKEIQPIHPKGDQSWVFIGRTDVEAETPIFWPSDAKSWLIRKDPDAGKDWRQEEKGTTEDEMVGWHHRLNGREFGWTPRVSYGQGGLAGWGSQGRKESDMTKHSFMLPHNAHSWYSFTHFLFQLFRGDTYQACPGPPRTHLWLEEAKATKSKNWLCCLLTPDLLSAATTLFSLGKAMVLSSVLDQCFLNGRGWKISPFCLMISNLS